MSDIKEGWERRLYITALPEVGEAAGLDVIDDVYSKAEYWSDQYTWERMAYGMEIRAKGADHTLIVVWPWPAITYMEVEDFPVRKDK
jgi:hypothetical protein